MKKLIAIAILSLCVSGVYAQNNNKTSSDSKERQQRTEFINAELAKIAAQQNAMTESQKVQVAEVKKNNATEPVSTPKTDLELRLENATKSGTPVKR